MIWVGVALVGLGGVFFGYRWGWVDARGETPAEHRPRRAPAWTMLAPGLLFVGSFLVATSLP